MKALLVRVGADQSESGGNWNGPVDSRTSAFVDVPIPETSSVHPTMNRPYSLVQSAVQAFGVSLPSWLENQDMHLDPDFDCLTYGDQGQRAVQIKEKLVPGDLLVFYSGLRDIHLQPNLIYAIIGLYVIDEIVSAHSIQRTRWGENAHTRRVLAHEACDIVVRAKPGVLGRLSRCLPIGSFRPPHHSPNKRPSYRVSPPLLSAWGGLTVTDGYLQRSARLPEFSDAARFYSWLRNHNNISLIAKNN
ncbi:MAG: hypothetical protein IT391_02150 [Nitrospira sp.]|nr:hypothetical protein [Nitrospira sp.]